MELIIPNSKLERNETEALEAKEATNKPVMSMLAAYIQSAFTAAEQHRQTNGITERLLKSRRLKDGQYDAAKLAQIRSVGSSEMFYNITEPKCESFVAWLSDVFNSAADTPWGIDPTPIPSLSVEETAKVQELVVQQFTAGMDPNQPIDPEQVKAFAQDLYDETLKLKAAKAKEKCDRMLKLIQDQTAEGGFADALSEFFDDLAVYPSAILKGPIFHHHKRLKWAEGKVQTVDEVIPSWVCVDPFHFYPGPNAKTVDHSYICEIIDYDKGELSNMRDLAGWKKDKIEESLRNGQTHSNSSGDSLSGESEMNVYEDKQSITGVSQSDATIRAIEFWGNIEGRLLLDWGMKPEKIQDPYKFYQVNCVLVNGVVIRSVLNPDPLGRKPYYVTSFIHNKNSLWGSKSIPEKIEDCQNGVNVSQRNLMNNLAFAAGPQVAADIDTIPASHMPTLNQQYPMKVWTFHGKENPSGRPPISFFQPNTNANELKAVAEFFENKADDRTLIPRYVTGDHNIGGAGSTASGLSMLMNASARSMKRVIRNIDREIIRPAINTIYTYNMLHSTDEAVKGDAQIVARGAVAMMVKEQTQLRQTEFFSMAVNSPLIQEIMGMERIANLLRAIAHNLDLPEQDLVPSKEELRARIQQQQLEKQMQAQMNPPPEEVPQ